MWASHAVGIGVGSNLPQLRQLTPWCSVCHVIIDGPSPNGTELLQRARSPKCLGSLSSSKGIAWHVRIQWCHTVLWQQLRPFLFIPAKGIHRCISSTHSRTPPSKTKGSTQLGLERMWQLIPSSEHCANTCQKNQESKPWDSRIHGNPVNSNPAFGHEKCRWSCGSAWSIEVHQMWESLRPKIAPRVFSTMHLCASHHVPSQPSQQSRPARRQ